MPIAWAPTVGRLASNVAIAAWLRALACPRGRGRGARRASPCRRAGSRRDAAVVEEDVGGVRGAQAVLLDLRAHRRGPACRAARRTRPGRASRARGRPTRRSTWTLGDAAVRRPRLLAVEDPLAGRPRRSARGCAATRRPSRRSARTTQNAATAGLVGACRSTAGPTRRSARRVPWPKIAATASDGAHDRHADAGVAPEELLVDDRQRQPGRVGEELGQPLEAVEADLRGLLDDRPGRLLALVPLGGGGAHDVLGEAVDPVAHVALVLGELEREGGGRGGVARGGGGGGVRHAGAGLLGSERWVQTA